jgi:hypothetical protein
MNSFWEFLAEDTPSGDDRAIEIIRRCSSPEIFKAIISRLSMVIAYARVFYRKELLILGTFTKEPEVLLINDDTATIVRLDLTLTASKDGELIATSHFFLLVNPEGQIMNVRNNI